MHTGGCARLTSVAMVAGMLFMAAPALARTYVTRGDAAGSAVFKPRSFVAGSGAGGGVLRLSGMSWSHWGTRSASGRGTFTYNICEPACASGNYRSASARVRLYRPRTGCEIYRDGMMVRSRVALFTRIELNYNGHTFHSLTAGTQSCQ
jgi:hypothetical protein